MRPLQTWDRAEFNTVSNAENGQTTARGVLRAMVGYAGLMCTSRESQDGPRGTNISFEMLRQED